MGGVLILAALTLTACDNFLDAKETCNQIQSAIAYNNASSYRILVTAEKDSGIIRKPITGEVSKKVTDTFDIKFEPNDDFSFMGWNAYSEELPLEADINDYIEFEDAQDLETKVTFKKALNGIVIMAVCPHYPFTEFTLTGSNGKFSPVKGNYTCIMNHTYNLSFEPDMDWEFIRWQIYDKNTDEEIPNGKYIKIQNLLEENTTYSLVCPAEDDQISLGIRPIVTERPQILSYSPILSNELAYKDTTIQVIFDHDMDKRSIYYDKNERIELTKKYKDITQFLSTNVNGEECFFGYERGGQKYFKNIMIQNNKTTENLNKYFTAPTFEGDRILTISTIADKKNLFENYTQILVILEKDFFYEQYDKPITMDSSKKWIYQVSAQTDSAGPIISAPAQDFSLKVYEKDGLKALSSMNKAPAMTLEAVSELNVISQDKLNLNVKITDTGCGPARTFDVILKRINDQNYKAVTEDDIVKTVEFDYISIQNGVFDGTIDLTDKNLKDGVYSLQFSFKDRSGNPSTYPESDKFYFLKDKTCSKVPSIEGRAVTNQNKIIIEWGEPTVIDFDHVEITFTTNDGTNESEPSSPLVITKTTTSYTFENIDFSKTSYNYSIVAYDILGNRSEPMSKTVDLTQNGIVSGGMIKIREDKLELTYNHYDDGVDIEGRYINAWLYAQTRLWQYNKSGNKGTYEIQELYCCDHEVTQFEYQMYCFYKDGLEPVFDYGLGNNYPAYNVSVYDAIVYCNLRSIAENLDPVYVLNEETDPSKWSGIVSSNGKYCGPEQNNDNWNNIQIITTANGYRLPSENEWDYIARGWWDCTITTYFGNCANNTDNEICYFEDEVYKSCYWNIENSNGKTHEVKTSLFVSKPDSLDIFDMAGNVWELCWKNGNSFYKHGGAWNSSMWEFASAPANDSEYETVTPSARNNDTGFRVVRNAR